MKSKTWIEEAKTQIVVNWYNVAKAYEGVFFLDTTCKPALAAKLAAMYPNVEVTVHYNSYGANHLSFAPIRIDITKKTSTTSKMSKRHSKRLLLFQRSVISSVSVRVTKLLSPTKNMQSAKKKKVKSASKSG